MLMSMQLPTSSRSLPLCRKLLYMEREKIQKNQFTQIVVLLQVNAPFYDKVQLSVWVMVSNVKSQNYSMTSFTFFDE